MRRTVARRVLVTLAHFLCIASIAGAQPPPTGRLTGTARDSSGAIIQGATIVATNTQTGSVFWATSNDAGVWVMPSVPGGRYTVSVDASGFQTARADATVDVAATATVDLTLQIGLREDVLVTASKYEQEVVNAPATASVVSEQAVRDGATRQMADLLRLVPGTNVAQMSARQVNVTSRSASGVLPTAQLVLVDGRTVYLDYLGITYWDGVQANVDEIKQIEVIRGPASAMWGSYAMNGVVNIITKSPREMLGTTLTLGVGTFDRSGGAADTNRGALYYLNATHAQVLNDHWAFKITGGVSTQDAFARPEGTLPNDFHTPYPSFPNTRATQPKVDARADYDLPDGKQHLTFGGGYTTGTGIFYTPLGPARTNHPDRAGYGRVSYARGALSITGYVNVFGANETYLLQVDPAGQEIRWIASAQIYNVDFSNSHIIGATRRVTHRVSYGGSFRHMDVSAVLMPGASRHNEGGAYAQDEMSLSKHFSWIVGARVDESDVLSHIVCSPRTTFMVAPVPGQVFRVSYNRAYVAPWTLLNYYQSTIMSGIDLGLIDPQLAGNYYAFPLSMSGTKGLEAQTLDAYEAAYTASLAKDRIHLAAAFYVNDSRGDFYWPQTGSYTSQNPPPGWPLPPWVLDALIAGNALGPGLGLPSAVSVGSRGWVRNMGLELGADVRVNRHVAGFANYSRQARPESNDFDISLINHPPTDRFNAGVSVNYKRYLGNVSVGYVGSAYWNDVINVIYSGSTKAYTLVNLSAGVRFGGGKYIAMLKVANLANTPIQNHVWGDILRRQVTGELRMRF
jgi:outer membrane receptor protein involved in Fe transport